MSRQATYGELGHYPGEVIPPKTNRRKFGRALIGGAVIGAAGLGVGAGYILSGRSPERSASATTEEDPGDDQLALAGENPTEEAQDEVAMAPDSNEGKVDTNFNYDILPKSENLTIPGRMSAEDIRAALKESSTYNEFMERFYTDKREVLLPNGELDVMKAGNAYLAGVEALLKAGCDRETLEERRYLDDPTPGRFVYDMSTFYDMYMIRGICGFSADMPTDEYILSEYTELIDAAAAARRLFWQNAKREGGNLNQRFEAILLDAEPTELEPDVDQDINRTRHSVNVYARLSNDVPGTDEQPLPIEPLEGRILMNMDIYSNRSQVTFVRTDELLHDESPLTELGSRY